ncbi:hypothetical protein Q7C36_014592 [Tachysurus vachellii]|uniref:Endonuclease/exonuclease/phosphatase domain-containing protein n=1 Tax=Tachysurus vachellii TaxID=175792 RepID=A0AA88MHL2_TACVA|nr:hypothetical protein Q7C36_014592 [Tachysurus vachellii]
MCRPFYLPREFTCVVVIAVYVHPDAKASIAMKELSSAINKLQTVHPDGVVIVAGDFNHCNLRSVLPKFQQNVSCFTRTLDHVHIHIQVCTRTSVAEAYRVTPLPHLGQSDHLLLFLLPEYSPVIRCVKPTIRTVKQQFSHTDWSEFASQAMTDSFTNINTYTNAVLDLINSCVDRMTRLKNIRVFPNQKPGMNQEVRLLLKACNTAFRSGDWGAYSVTRADLRRGICKAKHAYKQQIEEHFNSADPRRMWQGIQAITDRKHNTCIQFCLTPQQAQTLLRSVVKTAHQIIGIELPTLENIFKKHCLQRARGIIKDPSHPNHGLFTLLPLGRRYRCLRARTNRLKNSFFPVAVTALNS